MPVTAASSSVTAPPVPLRSIARVSRVQSFTAWGEAALGMRAATVEVGRIEDNACDPASCPITRRSRADHAPRHAPVTRRSRVARRGTLRSTTCCPRHARDRPEPRKPRRHAGSHALHRRPSTVRRSRCDIRGNGASAAATPRWRCAPTGRHTSRRRVATWASAHVRFHGILDDDMGTLICQNDALLYSFFNTDRIVDFLLSIGMKPVVELSFMPRTLSSGGDIVFHYQGNITPPKDVDAWGHARAQARRPLGRSLRRRRSAAVAVRMLERAEPAGVLDRRPGRLFRALPRDRRGDQGGGSAVAGRRAGHGPATHGCPSSPRSAQPRPSPAISSARTTTRPTRSARSTPTRSRNSRIRRRA